MPRCQRTFVRLSGGEPCSVCPEAEKYEAVSDPDLMAYADRSLAEITRLFGRPPDANRLTNYWHGLRPECVWEPADRRYDIYVHGVHPGQLRLQLGHELFHRVCSRGRVFHWTHEMLACVTSVHLLRVSGFDDYADLMEKQYAQEAELLSIEAMMAVDLWASPNHPAGFYGRAYVTGAALAERLDWAVLRRLIQNLPDEERWISGLTPQESIIAARLLGRTKE